MTTPKAGLKTMPTGILKNEQVFNELAILFEALIYRGVISRAMLDPVGISPPPENGDIYLINDGSPNPTGDWSGQGGKMAVYSDGWRFLPPDEGLTLWITDEAQSVQYRSGVWVDINEVPPQTLGDLSDVDLSGSPSPQDGDSLVFDGVLGVWGAAAFKGAKASHTTGQSITSSNAVLDLANEVFDEGGFHVSGANDSRLTVPEDGYYVAIAQIRSSVSDNFVFHSIEILLDGTTIIAKNQITHDVTVTTFISIQVSSPPMFLTAGQYIEMRVAWSPTNAAANGEHFTFLAIHKIDH